MAAATVREVQQFFGMTIKSFKEEWTNGGLTDTDKSQIRDGIGNGTLTY